MPGRYAVQVLQPGINDPRGLAGAGFDFAALAVIGVAAGVMGARLFRWDTGRNPGRRAWPGIAVALLSWVGVGVAAAVSGRLQPVLPGGAVWASITDAQIDSISYQDVPGDFEFVTPLAPPFKTPADAAKVALFAGRLRDWAPGRLDDAGQSIRYLVGVAAVADLIRDSREADLARAVYDLLRSRFTDDQLRHGLAWIILAPDEGAVRVNLPELGFARHPPESAVRSRSVLYAEKFLGRVVGRIRDP